MTSKEFKEIGIAIPCAGDVDPLVLQDYMQWMFHLGRRCQDWNFALAIKPRSEQYRARNALLEEFLVRGSDYIFMLDDDQIIGIDDLAKNYSFLPKLASILETRSEIGAIGGFYLQRRDSCSPVLLNEAENVPGAYRPLIHLEVSGGMQKVDVIGGGCMLFPKKVFDKIPSPWFRPESDAGYSTDIQICRLIAEAGFEIWADTSVHLGHLRNDRQIITMKTASLLTYEGREDASKMGDSIQRRRL